VITVVTAAGTREVTGEVREGRVVLDADGVEGATGFVPKPEGLCHGDVCVPTTLQPGLEVDGGFDAELLGRALDRVVATDPATSTVVVGDPVGERTTVRRGDVAPEFSLPDLEGRDVALRDFAGRKRLLLAWASW
jgi:hypothetical protein